MFQIRYAKTANNPQAGALYMQKEAEDQGWSVSAIEASSTDAKESGTAGGTATEESPYWWQFKQKVTATEA